MKLEVQLLNYSKIDNVFMKFSFIFIDVLGINGNCRRIPFLCFFFQLNMLENFDIEICSCEFSLLVIFFYSDFLSAILRGEGKDEGVSFLRRYFDAKRYMTPFDYCSDKFRQG